MTTKTTTHWWAGKAPAARIEVQDDPTEGRDGHLVVEVLDGYEGPVPGFRTQDTYAGRLVTGRSPQVVASEGMARPVDDAWFWWPPTD